MDRAPQVPEPNIQTQSAANLSQALQNIKNGERVYVMFKKNKKNQPKNK